MAHETEDPILALAAGHRLAGRPGEAIALLRQEIERRPNDSRPFRELGECFRQVGDGMRAIQALERAIALDPTELTAYRSLADAALAQAAKLGLASKAGGELKKIAAMYVTALGEQQRRQGLIAAEASFREASTLDTKNAASCYGLGEFLVSAGRYGEAEKSLRRAIVLDPKRAAAHVELGNTLQSLGRYAEMEAAYRRALALDPALRRVRESLDSLPLLLTLYDSDSTPASIYDRHRAWGDRVIAEARAETVAAPAFANARDPDRRLRVAFLSPDFRYHAVSFFFEPLLAHHDREAIAIYCYADVETPDFVSAALQQLGGIWRQTFTLDDAALRAQLRADAIDIAIDLSGHTGPGRLHAFAVKPAPVTATWLGYPATTGLSTVDWRITDARADPPGQEAFHTEKLLRLPETFLCHHFFGSVTPAIVPPPARARGSITFGSFNNPQKLSPPTVAAWARILDAVPDSRLMLKSLLFKEPTQRQRFIDRFHAAGIDAAHLVLREPQPSMLDHLASYGDIDIALDPFPYNGTTTTCEAMLMGVPVVSLIGNRHAARVGFDLLSIVGLGDLAAATVEDYIAIAARLAQDPLRLAELRCTLRERLQQSPLGDAPRFARNFEAALRQMWRDWTG
ncbi:MAG TPA: tetratricopeptide repeat protein [Stellaceae bacterium]|nr:tetratricopeptide repeat protein [Stellaceae bacterium]